MIFFFVVGKPFYLWVQLISTFPFSDLFLWMVLLFCFTFFKKSPKTFRHSLLYIVSQKCTKAVEF